MSHITNDNPSTYDNPSIENLATTKEDVTDRATIYAKTSKQQTFDARPPKHQSNQSPEQTKDTKNKQTANILGA